MGFFDFTFIEKAYHIEPSWKEWLTSLTSIAGAAATFWAVIVARKAMRESVIASQNSFKPLIRPYFRDMENKIEIGLMNYGNGAAIILDVHAFNPNNPRINPNDASCPLINVGLPDTPIGFSYSNFLIRTEGVCVQAGGKEPLLQLVKSKKIRRKHKASSQAQLMDYRRYLANNVLISFRYANFLGEEMELNQPNNRLINPHSVYGRHFY